MEISDNCDPSPVSTMRNDGILIVDDDMISLNMLRLVFEMEGCVVTCVTDGFKALELLKANKYSLLLTDYNMPGINGLLLSEKAKSAVPDLKIIMITGDSLQYLSVKASELGVVAVLQKPLDIKRLFNMINIRSHAKTPSEA